MVGAALLAVLAIYSVRTTSGDYLYVPNKASPVADNVKVEGDPEADARGGIYYVDVIVREERWIERILPFLRPDGATVVAGEAVTARGESFAERRSKAAAEMARSEQVAAAVALRAGGLHVTAVPRGVLVSAVATDVPAAGVLEEGDVITRAGAKPTRTPAALRAVVGALKPGQAIKLQLRRAGPGSTGSSRPWPHRTSPDARSSGFRSSRTSRSSFPFRSRSISVRSAAHRPGSRSHSRSCRSSERTSIAATEWRQPARSARRHRRARSAGSSRKHCGVTEGWRRRLPRSGWGERGDGHGDMQAICGSSLWRAFNRRCVS